MDAPFAVQTPCRTRTARPRPHPHVANYTNSTFWTKTFCTQKHSGETEYSKYSKQMSDHTCMWEKYSHPTVISNGRGGFSYHSGNTWGCEQFFRPGEEVISGAVFCARVLLAGRSSGVKITNKAVNIEDFDGIWISVGCYSSRAGRIYSK